MLPAVYRLPKDQIRRAFHDGRRIFSPPFLGYVLDAQTATPRFAIIIGKRYVKLASKRNRIKRLIRHGLISLLSDIKKPIDGVIVLQATPKEINQSIVNELLKQLLHRV